MKKSTDCFHVLRNVLFSLLASSCVFANIWEAHAVAFNPPDGDVAGLIAAINIANATPGPDTINLASGGTYTLTAEDNRSVCGANGLPVIRSEIVFQGNNATIHRVSIDAFRIFCVSSTGVLSLADMEVSGGQAQDWGGALMNYGSSSLTRVVVSRNKSADGRSCGAIANRGTVTITDSILQENETGWGSSGGALCNPTTATLVRTTVSQNIAHYAGGGISNTGTLTLTNSTVSGNTAAYYGGGIRNAGGGTVILNNSTVANNAGNLGSGISNGDGTANAGTVTLRNSLIADSINGDDCLGVIAVEGNSFIENPGACSIVGSGTLNGGFDPMLGPLADNGGPTFTHALLAGSPAIDAVPVASCTDTAGNPLATDQRGISRPKGIACDIGAFETSNNAPPVANAGVDQNIFLTQTALLDGSASSDPEGSAISYLWAIDAAPVGSTATLSCTTCVNPTLTPDIAGSYTLSLVVNDGVQDSAAATVSITATENLPPVAAATGSPTSGLLPLAVSFSAGASNDPEGGALTYSWDFGDPASGPDNSSTLVNPIHLYNAAGTYNAVVTVTDNFSQTDQASVQVIVTAPNLPPTVSPTATPSSGTAPLNVQFAAGASDVNTDDVLTYSWDFGDSGTSTSASPLHSYAVAGTYTATVAVADGVNPAVSSSLVISVDSPLEISVSESKVDYGEKGKVKGKISLKADFTYSGMPAPSDVIKVVFDGITLLEASFSSFEQESDDLGEFEYESGNVHAKIDFTKMTIKVSRHRMLLSGLDTNNGIDVVVYFGSHSATDHFVPKVKVKKHHDDEKEMSYKR